MVLVTAEIADPTHPARQIACATKTWFGEELGRLAAEMGAREPEMLGHQLAVLLDGAMIQSAAIGSTAPMDYARAAATTLMDLSLR